MKPKTIQRNYLREAAFALVLARLAVRFTPSERLFAWVNRPPRFIDRFARDEANWVAWAIESLGGHPWINALCLPRALAAHAMLRRRGIVSRVCLGVARNGGELAAHAWVEVGIDKIVGGAQAEGLCRIAEFGSACR